MHSSTSTGKPTNAIGTQRATSKLGLVLGFLFWNQPGNVLGSERSITGVVTTTWPYEYQFLRLVGGTDEPPYGCCCVLLNNNSVSLCLPIA